MSDAAPSNHLEHGGHPYLVAMQMLHDRLRPRTYLEIGARHGSTLKLAACATIAIDPTFRISQDVIGSKPACLLFQMESDAFFAAHDPARLLGAAIDLAFIDGMHLIEFALRDFINVERFCHPASHIVVHDCLPIDVPMTARRYTPEVKAVSRYPGWWTGDVWKLVPILRRYRPDLTIRGFDAPPTGLLMVGGLSPNDTTLASAFPDILREFEGLALTEESLRAFRHSLPTEPTDRIADLPAMAR